MAEVIKCDWCGATTLESAMLNWFVLSMDDRGFKFRTAQDEPGPWNLCCLDCVSEWAAERAKPDPDLVPSHSGDET